MAMTLVSTVTVGAGGAATIQFSNIPQTGKDLLVVASLRDTGNQGSLRDGIFWVNNDLNSYSLRRLYGTGSSVFSDTYVSSGLQILGMTQTNADTASTFSNVSIYIPNYTSSSTKSFSVDAVAENNATSAIQSISAGTWNNSAAITSITIQAGAVNHAQNSTASLYIIN